MRKRFNYFDDDEPIIQGIEEKSKLHNFVAFVKYVVIVTLFTVKDFVKRQLTEVRAKEKPQGKQSRRPFSLPKGLMLAISLVLIIAVIVSGVVFSFRNQDRRDREFSKNAYSICSEYSEAYGVCNYKNLSAEYGVNGYMLTGLCYVREIDFNNDKNSELLLIYNDNDVFYAEVWGFSSKKFVMMYKQRISNSSNLNDDIFLAVYSESSRHYIAQHDASDITQVDYMKMSDDKFIKRFHGTYDAVTQTYDINGSEATGTTERIRLSPVSTGFASQAVENMLDTVDGFMTESKQSKNSQTSVKRNGIYGAYGEIIGKYSEKYGKAKVSSDGSFSYIDGLAYVDLIDFDGDDINELVLAYYSPRLVRDEDSNGNMITYNVSEYSLEIYAWKNKRAVPIYRCDGLSNLLNSPDTRYFVSMKNGKNNFLCSNKFNIDSSNNTIDATSSVMKYENGAFVSEIKARNYTRYGYTEYYLNNKYVYKSAYENEGGFTVPFSDGNDEEYDHSKWNIVYVRLPGSKKALLEAQVNITHDNIKKIIPEYS